MRFLGKCAAILAMAIICWLLCVIRILSEECTPSWFAFSSAKMAILFPPAVIFKTSAVSSMGFHRVRLGCRVVKDFKQEAIH